MYFTILEAKNKKLIKHNIFFIFQKLSVEDRFMELMRTHLFEYHQKHGQLTEFAGFEMPIWYEGIVPEHMAVREAVGVFDVTHMGRCIVEGKDATAFLNYIFTRDIAPLDLGQGRYSVMCNENGGIIDDLVAFRLKNNSFLLVYNASNRRKDYEWINAKAQGFRVTIRDISEETPMFAVQGPKAISTLQPIVGSDLNSLRYYWGTFMTINEFTAFITRTGYTGEDGFEIFLWDTPLAEAKKAVRLWQTILRAGQPYGIKPCGLGARDTLRLEAGMCLYGNELDEKTTPLEAGLDFVVQFDKQDFIGKEAILKQKAEGIRRLRVGIRVLGKGIPRSGNKIFLKEKEIGNMTSGTFSPLLKCGIGMGYVTPELAKIGARIDILIRQNLIPSEIVEMPFYDITKYGRRRQKT